VGLATHVGLNPTKRIPRLQSWEYVSLTAVLTILSALESFLCPWSPYFIVYAILVIIIPIYFKTYKVGKFNKKTVVLFTKLLLISVLFTMVSEVVYVLILKYLSLKGDVFYDLNASLLELGKIVESKFGISTSLAMLIYAFYILIWAPIGEELFYRGFLFGTLYKRYSYMISALISSFFFGIRHLVHFLLFPEYPLFAELFYFYITFGYGLILTYAYKKTENIYVPIMVHFLTNVLILVGMVSNVYF
jgi:membrane protease YdiL (CAAX protease family)